MPHELRQLIEADQKYREIIENAQDMLKKTIANMEAEKQAFKADYVKKAEAELQRYRENGEREIQDACAGIDKRYAQLKAALDKVYTEGRPAMEKRLYESCITSDPREV